MYIHYIFFCFLHSTPLTNTFSHSIWRHYTFWGSFCYLLILLVAYFVLYSLFEVLLSCFIYCDIKQCLFLSTFLLAYNCVYFDLGSSTIITYDYSPFILAILPSVFTSHLECSLVIFPHPPLPFFSSTIHITTLFKGVLLLFAYFISCIFCIVFAV